MLNYRKDYSALWHCRNFNLTSESSQISIWRPQTQDKGIGSLWPKWPTQEVFDGSQWEYREKPNMCVWTICLILKIVGKGEGGEFTIFLKLLLKKQTNLYLVVLWCVLSFLLYQSPNLAQSPNFLRGLFHEIIFRKKHIN